MEARWLPNLSSPMSSSPAPAPASAVVTEIGQIAITVSDVAKATAFYRDVVGLKFLFPAGPNLAFLALGVWLFRRIEK